MINIKWFSALASSWLSDFLFPAGHFLSPGAAGSDAAVPRLSFSAALTSSMTKSGTIVFNKVLVNDQNAYNPGTGGSPWSPR